MKKYTFFILLSICSYITLAQDILLDNGQVEIILDDSIAPGLEGPYYRSWYMGVNNPFAQKDHFTITRSSVFFGLFTQFSALTIDDSTLYVGIGNNDPLAKLHINHSSLTNNHERPAILAGNYAGSSFGYLTINKPEDDNNDAIAKFRDDGSTVMDINEQEHAYQLDLFGDLRANNFMMVSDASVKTNIEPILNNLETLKKLKPSSYYLKKDLGKSSTDRAETQFGFVAQELQKVLPNLVKSAPRISQNGDQEDLLAVNYIGLIPILVGANQELSTALDNEKKEIEKLKNQINALEETLNKLEKKILKK